MTTTPGPALPPLPVPYCRLKWEREDVFTAEDMRSYALQAIEAYKGDAEAMGRRLVWAMEHMGMNNEHSREFVSHVLRRCGTGDLDDCVTYIDAATAAQRDKV